MDGKLTEKLQCELAEGGSGFTDETKIECEAKIHCSLKGTSLSSLFLFFFSFFLPPTPGNTILYIYKFSIRKSK